MLFLSGRSEQKSWKLQIQVLRQTRDLIDATFQFLVFKRDEPTKYWM